MMHPNSNSHSSELNLRQELDAFATYLAAAQLANQHRSGRARAEVQARSAGVAPFGTHDDSLDTVRNWTNELITVVEARCAQPPPVKVLCAFGSVLDHTFHLDPEHPKKLQSLIDWIEKHAPKYPADQRSNKPLAFVLHPQDILEMLRSVLPKEEGGKTAVENAALRHSLVYEEFPADCETLGGAAAIISEVLNQLGVTSSFYAPYHSEAIAGKCSNGTFWLNLNASEPLVPRPARESGSPGHPTRHGFAFAYQAGPYPALGSPSGSPVTAPKSDRHILVLKPPMGPRQWKTWQFEDQPPASDLEPNEWPNPPGFVCWEITGDVLKIWQAPPEWLQTMGQQHAYIVVTIPQPKEIHGAAEPILREQFRELHKAGAVLFMEFSSAAQPTDDLDAFAEFSKGTLDSVGINAEELPSYAALVDDKRWPLPLDNVKPSVPRPPERFDQALALARKLGIERLYVHGNDIDIILRRGADLDALEAERQGALFAKGAVLVATVWRNGLRTADLIMPDHFAEHALAALLELRDHLGSRPGERPNRMNEEVVIAAPSPDDYGVVAVPCIWLDPKNPKTPRRFSATGAGDITSGVSLVYSDYHKTRQAWSDKARAEQIH